MIQIDSVTHHIGPAPILQDVTLTLPKGGVTALIGPNGAGKSTLMSLIARLTPLQRGTVIIDGLPVGPTSDKEMARKLAILPQRLTVSTRLTVRELVGFGRYPHSHGRLGPTDHAKVDEALTLFALDNLADRQIDTLSGGQQQRAFLAMAFAQDTDYLLLDEPLNNLDLAGAERLLATLHHLARDHDKTVLLVVHDLNIAARHAQHIVALRDGRVAGTGAPADLLTTDFVAKVFGISAPVQTIGGAPTVLL